MMTPFHAALLAMLSGEDPRNPKRPPPPPSPGLTGADLEQAHAAREYDTANKTAMQANHDAYDPRQPLSGIAPAVQRGQQAVGTMQQGLEDQMNLRRMVAAMLGRPQ